MNAVAAYMAKLRADAVLKPEDADALEVLLNKHIDWHVQSNDQTARVWVAEVGPWTLVLTDFSIATQPGFKPGDRGQNVAISNADLKLVLLSDGALQHELARHLYLKIAAKPLNQFVGQAKNQGVRVQYLEQEAKRYNLDSFEAVEAACRWLGNHIAALGDKIWGIPETGTYFQFKTEAKIAYWWGNPSASTNFVLTCMGWTVWQRDLSEPTSNN